MKSTTRVSLVILLLALVVIGVSPALAQDQLNLADGGYNNAFFGAGSVHVTLLMEAQNCPGFPAATVCYFASSTATGSGPHLGGSSGTYTISTPAVGCSTTPPVGCAGPFSLTVNASGNSTVMQTAPITFSYTSPQGTLEGLIQFSMVSATNSHLESMATGTFTATGGTFAPYFASGGNVNLGFGLTFPLQSLWMIHGFDTLQIHPGTIVANSTCTTQSSNSSNFNGTPIQAGNYIWFNANFQAQGAIEEGTTLNLTNATVQFSANGNNYTLPAPNATVTFSASYPCASTSFNTLTQTWETHVPLASSDEVFLDGLSYPVPAPGLPGGINPIVWSGDFSSSVSGLTIQWKWGAAVYTQFSTDYNTLGVKATHLPDCTYNNNDHAGTPEGVDSSNEPWKDFVIGGARGGGGSNWTGSWSGTVSVTMTCQVRDQSLFLK